MKPKLSQAKVPLGKTPLVSPPFDEKIPPTVVQPSCPPPDGAISRYAGKASVGLGVVQILGGVCMLGLVSIAAVFGGGETPRCATGSGVGVGFFIIITGIIGIVAGKKKRKGLIVAFMVLSILTLVVLSLGFASAVVKVAYAKHYADKFSPDDDMFYPNPEGTAKPRARRSFGGQHGPHHGPWGQQHHAGGNWHDHMRQWGAHKPRLPPPPPRPSNTKPLLPMGVRPPSPPPGVVGPKLPKTPLMQMPESAEARLAGSGKMTEPDFGKHHAGINLKVISYGMALNGLLLMITCLVAAIIACRGVCCRRHNPSINYYVSTPVMTTVSPFTDDPEKKIPIDEMFPDDGATPTAPCELVAPTPPTYTQSPPTYSTIDIQTEPEVGTDLGAPEVNNENN